MADSKSDDAATRMGRFRICPPNAPGPPGEQVSHGRFRIIPQSNLTVFCAFFSSNTVLLFAEESCSHRIFPIFNKISLK